MRITIKKMKKGIIENILSRQVDQKTNIISKHIDSNH